MGQRKILLEVCVDSISSCLAAFRGGADRLELCSALSEGGLTPSPGLLKITKKLTESRSNFQIFVMIRPRRGDFLYSSDELDTMIEDINLFKSYGADGFVFGCLTKDGSLDLEKNQRLLQAASPMPCTLHRAIDVCNNFEQCLIEAQTLGFKRILTSGQRKSAMDGISTISKFQQIYKNNLIIMPGVGIDETNVLEIIQTTHANEVHSSASIPVYSKMEYYNKACGMSNESMNEYITKVTSAEKVQRIITELEKLD